MLFFDKDYYSKLKVNFIGSFSGLSIKYFI